jgi:protein-tyrosine phosphatase
VTDDTRDQARTIRRVLVLCAGNICRSPAAATVLSHLANDTLQLEVRSRGVHDWNVGKSAHPSMTRIAAQRGYDLSAHIAGQVTADDLAWADDILVMDQDNYQQLCQHYPAELVSRVRLLDPNGIPDPWLADNDSAYTQALNQIERAAHAYLASINHTT